MRRGRRAQGTRAWLAGGCVGAIGLRGTKEASRAMERGGEEGRKRRGRKLGGRKEASARSARGERKRRRARGVQRVRDEGGERRGR